MTDRKTALVLRNCRADMTSKNGFKWPGVGEVAEAPDWSPEPECGNGLHGWLYGAGDSKASDYWSPESKWLVVEVDESEIVHLSGKCKFPRATVRFVGDMKDATGYLMAHEPRSLGVAVIGATVTAGYSGTATAGDRGTATAGDLGTATAGDLGTATAGYSGTATAGDLGTATAGYRGTATAGDRGTATAGDRGTATAGDSGTATAGDLGTATAGDLGQLLIKYWDNVSERYRTAIAYVGENGIESNTPYKLDENHQFIKA